MSTFPIEDVPAICKHGSLYLVTKWLFYNWATGKLEEFTCSFLNISSEVLDREYILLFPYHKGYLHLHLAKDDGRRSFLKKESDENLAIKVGKDFELKKDEGKLKYTLAKLMKDDRARVEEYFHCHWDVYIRAPCDEC